MAKFPRFCDHMNRRDFLPAGSLAGLSLAQVLQMQAVSAAAQAKQTKDVNCIFIFIIGGLAH